MGAANSAEKVTVTLLSENMERTLFKCNWVLRDVLLRKIRKQAQAFDVAMPDGFGMNPNAPSRRKTSNKEFAKV